MPNDQEILQIVKRKLSNLMKQEENKYRGSKVNYYSNLLDGIWRYRGIYENPTHTFTRYEYFKIMLCDQMLVKLHEETLQLDETTQQQIRDRFRLLEENNN
jgi:hypothetical protein